ncbi:MAG: hypothetical protein ABSG78_21785 [Verrucomicrobiota bacterium]|jgi:hypothetical protein
MKTLAPLLILASVAGCSTTAPLPKAESPRFAAVLVPAPAELKLERIVIRAVHGQVQYWDGNLWAGLRPNMVLTNGVQIRPSADSSVDLFGGYCVSMRLMADHSQNVKAFLVHCGRASQATPIVRSSADNAIPGSVLEPSAPPMPQTPAGQVLAPPGAADVAIGTDGKVWVVTGELMLTGDGKTHLLRVGQYFDANTGQVRGETRSKPGRTPIISRTPGPAEIVSAPRAVLFDGGLENARRDLCWLGQ